MAETKPTTTNPGIPTDPAAKPSSPIPNPQSLAAQDSSPLALSHQPSTTPQAAAPNPPPAETAATLPPDAGVRHDAIASTVQVPVRSHQLPVGGMQAATPPKLATKEDRPATGLALPMPVSNADSRKSDTEAIAAPTGGEGSTSKKESPWKPSPLRSTAVSTASPPCKERLKTCLWLLNRVGRNRLGVACERARSWNSSGSRCTIRDTTPCTYPTQGTSIRIPLTGRGQRANSTRTAKRNAQYRNPPIRTKSHEQELVAAPVICGVPIK